MASLNQAPTKPTISGCAAQCMESFQQCLPAAASIHARELALVENQLAKFSLWTANFKVFASGRESLDDCLREVFDIQDAIMGVVEALNYRILKCTLILKTCSPVILDRPPPAIDARFNTALQDIAKQIALLHKFSNIIHRASREAENSPAVAGFQIQDNRGDDLKEVFSHQICDKFPGISATIQQRLASTMFLRCKRILYQRSHFDKFLGKAGNPSIPVALTAEIGDHGDIPFPPAPCGNIMRKYNKLKKQRGEEYNIDQENEHADLTASQEYRDILKNDWNEIVEAAREVDCPFCCSTLPARDAVDDNKWKLHVQNDIDPYVCLFEGCESPEELYNHSTWLKHMSSHYMQWRCISKAHIEFRSATKSEYINHMKDVHPDKFTNAQLNIIANRNARPISSMFKPCPLCGIEVVDGNKSDHVARHLLHLALKSLPSYEENIEKHENLEYQKNDISISSARRENAIRLDEQIHVYHDTGAYATASVREQMPKDYNYSMKRFLSHSEIPEGRSLLCFGEAESVEKAKDRARIRLNDFNAQFGSSINPPSETEYLINRRTPLLDHSRVVPGDKRSPSIDSLYFSDNGY